MDDEALKMANRIADQVVPEDSVTDARWRLAWLRARDAALLTMVETTQAAVMHLGAVRVGYERNGLNADLFGVAADTLRNNDHLKGPKL